MQPILTDSQFVTFLAASPCLFLVAGFAAGKWFFRDILAQGE